jgi:hypothetical protein
VSFYSPPGYRPDARPRRRKAADPRRLASRAKWFGTIADPTNRGRRSVAGQAASLGRLGEQHLRDLAAQFERLAEGVDEVASG